MGFTKQKPTVMKHALLETYKLHRLAITYTTRVNISPEKTPSYSYKYLDFGCKSQPENKSFIKELQFLWWTDLKLGFTKQKPIVIKHASLETYKLHRLAITYTTIVNMSPKKQSRQPTRKIFGLSCKSQPDWETFKLMTLL